ncbi:MAG: flippase activity-associated protein Agl23, partial [Pyrinomonadaceae bacterium]
LGLVVAILLFIRNREAGPFAIGWAALVLLVCFLPSTLKLANNLAGTGSESIWLYRGGVFLIECVLVVFVVRMLLTWNSGGRPIYFLLAAACLSLMFATKETAFITAGTMLIACSCIRLWRKIYSPAIAESGKDEIDDHEISWGNLTSAFGSRSDAILTIVAAAFVFLYVSIVFFSSFFTYSEGIGKALEAYAIWTKTGSRDHTQNGMLAYLDWGLATEAPLLILAAIGTLIAFFKSRHRFAMFASLWAFGLFLAYTIIPYKTPWLAISFLLPMCIVGGYAVNELVGSRETWKLYTGIFLGVAGGLVLAYQTFDLNFVRYDDEDTPYVYAHTQRAFHDLIRQIEHYAEKSGKGTATKIQIVSPDYWPLVWYLRDYKEANFHGRVVEDQNAEMIIAKKGEQDAEVTSRFASKYERVGSYALRSGVELVLLVRKDLADTKH